MAKNSCGSVVYKSTGQDFTQLNSIAKEDRSKKIT